MPRKKVKLGLALQGGGAYGAFTKGALIRLLQDPLVQSGEIEIIAVSGTSAGALNGACLTAGLNASKNGPNKAIENLTQIWDRVAVHTPYNPLLFPFTKWPNLPIKLDFISQFMSLKWVREQLRNALNDTLSAQNWNDLKNTNKTLFFANTVIDQKGKLTNHVFDQRKLRAKDIVATASLMFMGSSKHHGVKMRDGAYLRNPDMAEIENVKGMSDLLTITLHGHPSEPILAGHQENRADKMVLSGDYKTQTSEIHAHLADVYNDRSRGFKLHEISYHPPRYHDETARMNNLADWLDELSDIGYKAADDWLKEHARKLGKEDTYQIPPNVINAQSQNHKTVSQTRLSHG